MSTTFFDLVSYSRRGNGMNVELLSALCTYTIPSALCWIRAGLRIWIRVFSRIRIKKWSKIGSRPRLGRIRIKIWVSLNNHLKTNINLNFSLSNIDIYESNNNSIY